MNLTKIIAWISLIAGIISGSYMVMTLRNRKQYMSKDSLILGYVIEFLFILLTIVSYIAIFLF